MALLLQQVDMEERFCSKVKELGCTCITISHRPALVAFHDLVLALDGEGGWSIHEGATGNFTEEPPILEEGGPTGRGNGATDSAGQGTARKTRGKDAAAVLQGMRVNYMLLMMHHCKHTYKALLSRTNIVLCTNTCLPRQENQRLEDHKGSSNSSACCRRSFCGACLNQVCINHLSKA